MTTTVDINEAQFDLKELVRQARAGSEVVILDADTPVARLVAVAAPTQKRRVAGLHPGAISTSANFDKPLPDTFWTGVE